jgi:hypothetical protein
VTWQNATGKQGVIPPKFNLDVTFFDNSETVNVDLANADNLQVSIPVAQRPLTDDEDPAELRRKITQTMMDPSA